MLIGELFLGVALLSGCSPATLGFLAIGRGPDPGELEIALVPCNSGPTRVSLATHEDGTGELAAWTIDTGQLHDGGLVVWPMIGASTTPGVSGGGQEGTLPHGSLLIGGRSGPNDGVISLWVGTDEVERLAPGKFLYYDSRDSDAIGQGSLQDFQEFAICP